MDNLPPEVFSGIVQLLRPKGLRVPRHVLPIEVVLSHVSTSWRRLAFSDSLCWEFVEVYSPKTLPRATSYLTRSANAAIHLRIDLWDYEVKLNWRRNSNPNDHQVFVSSLIDLIRSAASRCKSILIFTFSERSAQQLSGALAGANAPLLQRLRIIIDEDGRDTDNVKHAADILTGAESLCFVELETPSFPPLHRLTTLCLHNCTSDWLTAQQLTRVIEESTHLENLSLSMAHPIFKDWPAQSLVNEGRPSVTTQSLLALRISEEESPGLATRVLLLIDAPNLISLTLMVTSTALETFFNSPQANTHENFKFPKLQYLSLESVNLQNTEQFIQTFPSITHLRISYLPAYFISRFTAELEGPGTPWPKLHTLVLEVTRETESKRVQDCLVKITTTRRERNLPVPRVLGDRDVLGMLGKSDFLNETVKMEELNTRNYREPWWILSYEGSVDKIGMP